MALAWAVWGGFLKESLDGAGDLLFGPAKTRPSSALYFSDGKRKCAEAAVCPGDCDRYPFFFPYAAIIGGFDAHSEHNRIAPKPAS